MKQGALQLQMVGLLFYVSLMCVHGLHILRRSMVLSQLNHGLNDQQQQQHHAHDQSALDTNTNIDIYSDSISDVEVTKQAVCFFQLGNTNEDKASVKVVKELFAAKTHVVGDNTIVYERIGAAKMGAVALEQALIATATEYFQSKCKNQPVLASGHSNGDGIGVSVKWIARGKKGGQVSAEGEERIRYPFDEWRKTSDSKSLYIASCMCNGVTGGTIKFCENRVVNPVQFKNGKYGWTSVASRAGAGVLGILGNFARGLPAVITDSKWTQIKQLDGTAKFITFDTDGTIQTEL